MDVFGSLTRLRVAMDVFGLLTRTKSGNGCV